jgi:hypothetical protein
MASARSTSFDLVNPKSCDLLLHQKNQHSSSTCGGDSENIEQQPCFCGEGTRYIVLTHGHSIKERLSDGPSVMFLHQAAKRSSFVPQDDKHQLLSPSLSDNIQYPISNNSLYGSLH